MEKGRNQGYVSQFNKEYNSLFNGCRKEFLKIPYRNNGCKSPINVIMWNERLLLTGHIWLPWVRATTFTLLPSPILYLPSLHICFSQRRWSQGNRKSFLQENSQGSLHMMHIELKLRWFSQDRKAALGFKCDIKATWPQWGGKSGEKGKSSIKRLATWQNILLLEVIMLKGFQKL